MDSSCLVNARSLLKRADLSSGGSMLLVRWRQKHIFWAQSPPSPTFFGLRICKLNMSKQSSNMGHKPFSVSATAKNLYNSGPAEEKELSNMSTVRRIDSIKTTHGGMRKYNFYQAGGGEVRVVVRKEDNCYKVSIVVSAMPGKETLYMHWASFRSRSSDWGVLDLKDMPAGTTRVAESLRTPFKEVESGVYCLEFELGSNYVPFFIGFSLSQSSNSTPRDVWSREVSDSNFLFPVGCGRGHTDPLGTVMQSNGSINFSLYSKNAAEVILCLYNAGSTQPSVELELQSSIHRTGNVWHIELDDIGLFDRYGYRCKGDISWEKGNRFHARRILLDPYAKALAPFMPGQDSLPSPALVLGLLTGKQPQFDWEVDVHRDIPLEKVVAYRLNVTGFTADKSSGLENSVMGTFDGLTEKIEHFKTLGVNSIILQPIFAFQKKKGALYPISFFAPMNCFGPSHTSISSSFSLKRAIRELHKNGIEVLLDVVFTHTGENNDEAPETVSFRGIDNATYYILDQNGRVTGSELGADNSFNCNHPVVQTMILDSLRHWVIEYHVDGFCFANASALTKGPHREELSRPLLVEAISFDPLLSKRKFFADTSSPFTRISKDLAFPHWKRWCLWNNRYRDDVRQFMRGDKGKLSSFATRLCGSGDILADGRGPCFSLNYVTSPYGLTLVDLVSYSANMVADSEWSWNCGEEGRTLNQAVLNIRVKQARNFLMCLFLSQGIPVLNMGDEYGLSKAGSVSIDQRFMTPRVFNWDALYLDYGKQITHLIASLAAFRERRSDLFQRTGFIKLENIKWHGAQTNEPDWESADSSFIAVSLRPEKASMGLQTAVGDIYIGFNPEDTPILASLPKPPAGMSWYRIADTSLPYPQNFLKDGLPITSLKAKSSGSIGTYEVQSHSSILLEARAVA